MPVFKMSVSIYHFPTPNGFVSVVGSANLSPGYSAARLNTFFVTGVVGRNGWPSEWGNVTVRTTATFGALLLKRKIKREGTICVDCPFRFAIPLIPGSKNPPSAGPRLEWKLARLVGSPSPSPRYSSAVRGADLL